MSYPDDMAPSEYGVYPGSTSEFRMFQKADGTFEQHVRYINTAQGYIGKWMVVQVAKEQPE